MKFDVLFPSSPKYLFVRCDAEKWEKQTKLQMKKLTKNTTTTTEASNAPTITTNNNPKNKEATNMKHPDGQTTTKPKSELKHVSFTAEEIEAAKKEVENFLSCIIECPYTPGDVYFDTLTMPAFERSRIADIYQTVFFNGNDANAKSIRDAGRAFMETTPALCAMLSIINLQNHICCAMEGWLKRQTLLLLEDVQKNPRQYDVCPDYDFCHDSYLERRAGFLHDVEYMVSQLPDGLAKRLEVCVNFPYRWIFDSSCFERRLVALWQLARAFDGVLTQLGRLFEEYAFTEEVASTKLVATK